MEWLDGEKEKGQRKLISDCHQRLSLLLHPTSASSFKRSYHIFPPLFCSLHYFSAPFLERLAGPLPLFSLPSPHENRSQKFVINIARKVNVIQEQVSE
jgi:hypothetical protein